MLKQIAAGLTLAMTVAGGPVGVAPRQAPPPVVLRVLPLGDSITRGDVAGGWRPVLAGRLDAAGARVVFVGSMSSAGLAHEGHGGWRIDQLAAVAAARVREYAPDVVLLMAGTNDLVQRRWAGMAGRLETLVRQVQAARPGVRVLLASVPQMRPRSAGLAAAWNAYRSAVPAVAARTGATWVRGDLVRYPTDLVSDGVHPSRCGYARLGWLWWHGWVRAVPAPAGRPWRVGPLPALCP